MRRVYLETYGCQMNVADSGLITHVLRSAGYEMTEVVSEATLVLLNTCAVRERAEERVAARLAQLARLKELRPDLVLGVTGCMPKHLGEALRARMPQVDLLIGPDSYRRLPELIEQAAQKPTTDLALRNEEDYSGLDPLAIDGINAFVPIMRGCDRFCTFCVVPLTRGREKCLPAAEVVRQVESAVLRGAKQVTLLGQTVNSWREGDRSFGELLSMVAQVPGVLRVRFTSPHPSHFSPDDFRRMAENPVIAPQVHLPLQSGSDRILSAMKRGYARRGFMEMVGAIRAFLPEVGLSTDIIVGMSGEEERDFEETLDVVRAVQFDSAFMFRYSPRSGTYAWRHQPDDVPVATKAARLDRLIAVQEEISRKRYARFVGMTVEVLVEGISRRRAEHAFGKTPCGKTVVFPAGPEVGTLAAVQVASATSHTLLGAGVGETEIALLESAEPESA